MALTATDRTNYVQREWGFLVGKTISSIRPLTEVECSGYGWDYDYEYEALRITFTDGTEIVPMQDAEGNGAGFLWISELSLDDIHGGQS